MPYSPDMVEGEFLEPRLDGVLRSSPRAKQDYVLRTAEARGVGGANQDEESGCCGVPVARRRDGVPDKWHFPYFNEEMGQAVGVGFVAAKPC